MVDATKEIVLKWQTKRFAGSRAKEWPAWKLKMQGLCYGCGAPGHIKMDCPKKNAQRSLGEQLALGMRTCEAARRLETEEDSAMGEEGKCFDVCGKEGHKAMDCPDCHMRDRSSEKVNNAAYVEETVASLGNLFLLGSTEGTIEVRGNCLPMRVRH